MLRCLVQSVSIPKAGHTLNENEDNILVPSFMELSAGAVMRFGISDGATESSFSREWSDLLVSGFKDGTTDEEGLCKLIENSAASWKAKTSSYDLPWYAEAKLNDGAFATLIGVEIDLDNCNYEALAIGDCCLFHIRNKQLHKAFPIIDFRSFGNNPNLIATNPVYRQNIFEKVERAEADLIPNDLLVLCSDAIAAWILQGGNDAARRCYTVYRMIDVKHSTADFETWINQLRGRCEMKNDDVSAITIMIK